MVLGHGRIGYIGGTLSSVLGSLQFDDYAATCVLAVFGSAVSFVSSVAFKQLRKHFKRKRKRKKNTR
ncbi:hypothetical protein [Psychroflexus sp. ALD_RP9]|jgi:hypothetical protein|uniref:hypothetical protein n=1 Tax=Psychroflexus sp. ALD_RP9 TaxID=2777186 RepID=UPI001A8CA148|nr:hypothetical protein [Psychroflexus sp. ALD_RP9]QSS96346.1 hypothetical protein IMZ30_07710 [Psychroflexus sp. ALD_RP9]